MGNLETTENKDQVKYDLAGTTLEVIQFNIVSGNKMGSLDVESLVNGRKQRHPANWLGFLINNLCIIEHEEATMTTTGIRRINDLMPNQVLLDSQLLEDEMNYPLGQGTSSRWGILEYSR